MKKVSHRKCIETMKVFPKDELLRIALTNPVQLDKESKIQSRGAYICKDKQIITSLVEKKKVKGKFTSEQKDQIINILMEYINE